MASPSSVWSGTVHSTTTGRTMPWRSACLTITCFFVSSESHLEVIVLPGDPRGASHLCALLAQAKSFVTLQKPEMWFLLLLFHVLKWSTMYVCFTKTQPISSFFYPHCCWKKDPKVKMSPGFTPYLMIFRVWSTCSIQNNLQLQL